MTVPSSGMRDLEICQHFQQKGLECLVGAVEFVDQQHRRACRRRLERLQQRPLDQEPLGEHVMLEPLAIVRRLRFRTRMCDHLRGVVPLVDCRRDVETFVALQPDEAGARAFARAPSPISVLPTPASPSRNKGRAILKLRKSTVPSARSARYPPRASSSTVASIEVGSGPGLACMRGL